jgi:hypothetical protein
MCNFFLFSDYDDVRMAVNSVVGTYMEKFSAIWKDCGYNDVGIQQRCDAIKKHVQVSSVLRAVCNYYYPVWFLVFRIICVFVLLFMIHKMGKEILPCLLDS